MGEREAWKGRVGENISCRRRDTLKYRGKIFTSRPARLWLPKDPLPRPGRSAWCRKWSPAPTGSRRDSSCQGPFAAYSRPVTASNGWKSKWRGWHASWLAGAANRERAGSGWRSPGAIKPLRNGRRTSTRCRPFLVIFNGPEIPATSGELHDVTVKALLRRCRNTCAHVVALTRVNAFTTARWQVTVKYAAWEQGGGT